MVTRRTLLTGGAAAATAAKRSPNILLLMSDDQRPDTIHSLGNRMIQTPTLDALAREGAAFTSAICANPLCVPSRAELITGATGFRNGVPQGGRLKADIALWPETLRRNGY